MCLDVSPVTRVPSPHTLGQQTPSKCVHLKGDHLGSDTMWNNASVVCGVCLQ